MRINAIGASLLFGKGRNAIYVTPLSLQLMQFQNFQKYLSCKILDITYLQKVAFPELITSYFPRPGPIYCIKYSLYDLQERKWKETLAMVVKYSSKYLSKMSQFSCIRELYLSPISVLLIRQSFSCVILSTIQTISKSTPKLIQVSFISMLQYISLSNVAEYAIQNVSIGNFTTSSLPDLEDIIY